MPIQTQQNLFIRNNSLEQFLKNCSPSELQQCRVCRCTDDDRSKCIEKTGKHCYWVEEDLCSTCDITNILENPD